MKECKLCKRQLSEGESHFCPQKNNEEISYSDGDFIVSAVIGAVTDSAILGGLIGGDIVGGIVGDLLDGDLFD
jgi:hypothetical protein